MGTPAWAQQPVEYRRQRTPEEQAARAEADALGMLHGRGVLPRQFRDDPAPRPPPRLGPLPLQLLQLLRQAAAPVTAAELAAHLGAPPLHVAAALGGLMRSGYVLAVRGDARGLRFWPSRRLRGRRR
jgi:hypothetical protein